MASSFPRIYSLSTIGIKQHFNCDYLFHPNRTDFSGESGSGKSMVADMIQLILVGSRVYKSSTESNKSREAKGMVQEAKGRQYGIGYIFLNIEVHYKKYIILGAYIESSHNKVQAFIIQAGYDWEEQLTPLSRPVSYRDLLIDDKVLPVESLEEQLTEIHLKQFSWKKYHQLLYDNELLTLDLNKDKILESYASILRSFSRGKGFKTDSASLKSFLFGDDDQNKLMQKYQEEVKAINDDFYEHQRYMSEIELINEKQRQVEDIIRLSAEYEARKQKYFTSKFWYWKGLYDKYKDELEDVNIQFNISECEQVLITEKKASLELDSLQQIKRLNKQLMNIEKVRPVSIINTSDPEVKFGKAKAEKDAIDKVERWIINNDNDLNKLKAWYHNELEKVNQKNLLNNFIEHLKQQGQLEAFNISKWCNSFEDQQTRFPSEMQELEDKINKFKSLSVFSDLNDSNSLAVWAKENLTFPLTHEIESVLIYFQQFPREEPNPEQKDRYLSFPGELFSNLEIKHKTKKGFWINLDGVYEHIKYSEGQLLNKPNIEELFSQLASITTGVKEQLDFLIKQKMQLLKLKETLYNFGGIQQAIKLYDNKEAILKYSPTDVTFLPPEEFNRLIELYNNKDRIIDTYYKAKSEYDQFTSQKDRIDKIKIELNQQLKHFNAISVDDLEADIKIEQRNAIIKEVELKLSNITKETNIEEIRNELFSNKVDLIEIYRLKADLTPKNLQIQNRKSELEQKFSNAKDLLDRFQQDYLIVFRKNFDFSDKQIVNQDPDEGENSLKEKYKHTEVEFQTKYDLIKESVENAAQLTDYSVSMLAHKLLPTVFENSKIDINLIEERIAERLGKLTRDIQEIGSRKVEILKRVFSEVYKTYNQYLEKIQGIDAYLKNKNHTITGGNRASLKYKKSPDYPDKWMAPFRKQLDEALINVGLFEDLKQEIDINKMMLKAFQAAGGSNKVSPEDLLNPKSYFDLDFDLKLDSGESNAGSQGQTYTANALLGLARLSLIETEKRNGLRIMPIDEAEGLGGNYDMLHKLAKQENYQIVSMSIETAGDILVGEQYIYIMNENNLADESSYVPPLGIFTEGDPIEDIESFIYKNETEV